MNKSVKKIVLATGMLTATKFLPMPLVQKFHPISPRNFATVSIKLRFVLNISFRITSTGLVSIAPAIPAVADLHADLIMVLRLYSSGDDDDDEDSLIFGNTSSM
mmetsp:Transcript_20446/g.31029  ORF Transcript_20446/g.31029 Transcript_20446/m.31029 type:complete len:104 (+) Transcript_20446:109-420(+)